MLAVQRAVQIVVQLVDNSKLKRITSISRQVSHHYLNCYSVTPTICLAYASIWGAGWSLPVQRMNSSMLPKAAIACCITAVVCPSRSNPERGKNHNPPIGADLTVSCEPEDFGCGIWRAAVLPAGLASRLHTFCAINQQLRLYLSERYLP